MQILNHNTVLLNKHPSSMKDAQKRTFRNDQNSELDKTRSMVHNHLYIRQTIDPIISQDKAPLT